MWTFPSTKLLVTVIVDIFVSIHLHDSLQATKAAEEEMEDTMLYDGDQQRYLQLLANGGEQEVGIDASDVDSSDVASSNDIDSDSDDDSDSGVGGDGRLRDKLVSSVARSAGRGKRGRAEMGRSAATEDGDEINADEQGNPLMAEIGSKTERRQAAAQRWFNDPLFAGVDEALAGTADRDGVDGDDEEGGEYDAEPRNSRKKRSRRGGGGGKGREENVQEEQKELGAAEELMAVMPMTEKDKRKEKRKKVKKVACRMLPNSLNQLGMETVCIVMSVYE